MSKPTERKQFTIQEARNRAAISRHELNQLTGISIPSIDRYLKSGQLEHTKIGGRVLIPARAFMQLLEGGEV